jgi:hypothetical protein
MGYLFAYEASFQGKDGGRRAQADWETGSPKKISEFSQTGRAAVL